MYRCQLRFYFVGTNCRIFELARELPQSDQFPCEFVESRTPESRFFTGTDAVLIRLADSELPGAVGQIADAVYPGCQVILLADEGQASLFSHIPERVSDVWALSMPDEEIRFRLERLLRSCRREREAWLLNQYLEATINGIPSLVWYKDRDGIHRKVNDSFCRAVNKTKEQVEGRDHYYIWDVDPEEAGTDWLESDQRTMESGQTCVTEEVVQTGDGQKLFTTYKSPLYDIDGTVIGTVGVGIDVTREHAYEQEIVQKSNTLELIFTSLDCGVLCHTVDGSRILSVNQAALRILGYESEEELTRNGFNMVAPSVLDEDKPKLRKCIRSLKKLGDSVNIEYGVQHKDGRLLHVMGNIKLLEENGELFYQRFLLDYTAKKQQEQQRERRQTELMQSLSSDYSMVCSFDLKTGKCFPIRVDESARSFFALPLSRELHLGEIRKNYLEKIVCDEDREKMEQATETASIIRELEEKGQCYLNHRILLDGEPRYYVMKIVRAGERLWKESKTVVVGFRSVDEDMRREIEQKHILEDALTQANRANKAKSIFLSNMSHDIRTPMNAIVGFTALAIAHMDRMEQVEDYLKKIQSSGNHLLGLINDVLDMSQIESGEIALEEIPCSLGDILRGMCDIVQVDVRSKQLELHMDAIDVQDEDVYCDKLRLNQILLNVVSNSVKYTNAGGLVSVRMVQKPGAPQGYGNYEFCIRDTGIGMKEEFLTHIFEPFERERNTTTSGIQGTGLGMAITRNLVEMMKGTIEVQSRQDVGTEVCLNFTFRLQTGERSQQNVSDWKGSRALVVASDSVAYGSASSLLNQIEIHTDRAQEPEEAIIRLRQASLAEPYRLILLDWRLPDQDVLGTVARLRAEAGPGCSLVVMTVYDWSELEVEARRAGVSAFCSKPLFLSGLKSCLHTISNRNNTGAAAGLEEQQFHNERILLVEDNELNQEIAATILGDAGFCTEIAENGQVAVDMVRNSAPGYYRVVLMDIQMPVMNGYEAARAIRALDNQKLSSIPILAMTANAFEEDRQEALRAGMNGHIAKPIDLGKLFEALRSILS